MIITQNGDSKAVLIDFKTYDEYRETIGILKILAQSNASLQRGKVKPAKQAIEDIKIKISRSR